MDSDRYIIIHELANLFLTNQYAHMISPVSGAVPHPPVYVTEKWDGTTMQVLTTAFE
jgi:hypothetical protein